MQVLFISKRCLGSSRQFLAVLLHARTFHVFPLACSIDSGCCPRWSNVIPTEQQSRQNHVRALFSLRVRSADYGIKVGSVTTAVSPGPMHSTRE